MEFFTKIKNNLKNIFKSPWVNSGHGKRFFVILLLFFIASGILIPKISLSFGESIIGAGVTSGGIWAYNNLIYDCYVGKTPEQMTPEERQKAMDCLQSQNNNISAVDNALGKLSNALDYLDRAAKGTLMAIITSVISVMILIISTLASMMGSLFLWVFNSSNKMSYTGFDNPAIAAGWPIARDFANMIIVLGLVIIGLATILRFNEYGAKKLLPRLIIAAILINFSLVICGVVIDVSNMIMSGLGINSGGYLQKTWAKNTSDTIGVMWEKFNIDKPAESLGTSIGLLFTEAMRFVIYSLFFFLFIARYVCLWILVILSPLAFVAAVFPAGQDMYRKWKTNFIQWSFIGIPAAFFLWLADKITAGMINSTSNNSSTAGSAASFIAFLLPGFFMIIGFIFSLQTSAMGASMITSKANQYFNKGKSMLGGTATSTAKKITGGAANLSGASRMYNWAGDKLTKFGEATHILNRGASAKRKATQMEGRAKLNNYEFMDEKELKAEYDRNNSVTNKWTDGARKNRAQITEILQRRKKLDTLGDSKEIGAALELTDKYYGGQKAKDIRKEAEKISPILRAENKSALEKAGKTLSKGGKAYHPTLSDATHYNDADMKKEAVRSAHADMSVSDMRNLDESQFSEDFLINDTNFGTIKVASREWNANQKAKAKDPVILQKLLDNAAAVVGCSSNYADIKAATMALPASDPKKKQAKEIIRRWRLYNNL